MTKFLLNTIQLLKEVFAELGYTKENLREKMKKYLKFVIRNFIGMITGFVSGCGASRTDTFQEKFHYEIVQSPPKGTSAPSEKNVELDVELKKDSHLETLVTPSLSPTRASDK